METQHLAEYFPYINRTESGIESTKKLILKLAIRGRLVRQFFDDEPSDSLVLELKKIKGTLISTGKIKNKQSFNPVGLNEVNYAIPEHWKWVRLEDIGQVVGGGTPQSTNPDYFDDNGTPWLTPADLRNIPSKYISKGSRGLSDLGLANSSAQSMPKYTVLFSSRAPIGHIAIAANPLATNQGFKSCVPFIPEMSEYIYYFLMAIADDIERAATGTTFKEVSGRTMAQIPVPLPPLPEQMRIVAKIEELFDYCTLLKKQQSDALKLSAAARQASITVLADSKSSLSIKTSWGKVQDNFLVFFSTPDAIKSLRQIIYDMASIGRLARRIDSITTVDVTVAAIDQARQDLLERKVIKQQRKSRPILRGEEPIFLPDTWRWVRLGDLCRAIEYGTSQKADDDFSGVPVLRMGNIVSGKIALDRLKYVDANIKDLPRLYVKNGDLLFNRTNSYELVGKLGHYRGEDDRFTFASYLIRISLFNQHVMPEWVSLFFQSSICRKTQIEPYITAQTNQANFNGAKLANVLVPLAPIEEQRDIINRTNSYLQLCDELEKQMSNRVDIQDRLALTVVQSIVNPGTPISVVNMDNDQEKASRRIRKLSVEIRLASPRKRNINRTTLAMILNKHGGRIEAKELWKASNLRDIDDFYAVLKQEIEAGFIQEPEIAEIKWVEEAE